MHRQEIAYKHKGTRAALHIHNSPVPSSSSMERSTVLTFSGLKGNHWSNPCTWYVVYSQHEYPYTNTCVIYSNLTCVIRKVQCTLNDGNQSDTHTHAFTYRYIHRYTHTQIHAHIDVCIRRYMRTQTHRSTLTSGKGSVSESCRGSR